MNSSRSENEAPFGGKTFIIFFGVLTSLALDQITKFWVAAAFRADETLSVIDGIFSLNLRTNPGAAFGIFRGRPVLFFLIVNAIAISFILGFVFRSDTNRRRLLWAMSLILGGALGNLSDRILRNGSVVDFLTVQFKGVAWPTFNIADISIVAGVLLFLLDMSMHELRVSAPGAHDRPGGGKPSGSGAETIAT